MEIIVIKIIIVYWLIATFILLNVLFNPQYRLIWVDEKTGNKIEPPFWVIALFCMYWPFYAIKILVGIRRKNK